jgi:GMP synthase-like glutamine amidotransferase
MARSIGILVTGSPPPELAERYPHYGRMAEELLHGADPTLQFRHYDIRAGEFPESVDDHDGWLITGSRHGAYEDLPWILRLAEFIRALDARTRPLVGICFGHQLIARALGGAVVKAPQGWGVGVHEAEVQKSAPWMDAGAERFKLVVSHQDQVTALPERAERLAGSAFCPIAMYRVGEHVFAMQAHPEFTREYSRELMELRRGLIGDERIEPGLRSLGSEVDSARVARWMAAFLNHAWTG